MLSRLACRSLGRLSNGFIFSYIPDFGDLIRGVDIFIKTSLGCWGWRSFSCTSCSGRGGDSAVFRLASCAHIHSHCLVLLPLMPRFWKGKPEFWGKMIWQSWQNTQNAQSVSFVIIGGFLSLGQQRESAATQGSSIGLRMSVVLCGQFCQSLLVLICISLSLSWILRESLIFF